MKSWSRLQSRERRVLAIGGAIVAAAIAYAWVVVPYLASLDRVRAELMAERGLEQRERELLAEAPAEPALLAETRAQLALVSNRLFSGVDSLGASAALTRYARGIAQSARVLLQSAEPEESAPAPGGLTRIRLSVRIVGDLEGVLDFVEGLEHGVRLISVRALSLAPEQDAPAWQSPQREALTLLATLEGYR
jgi:Tfp pilus assembly protein PilO